MDQEYEFQNATPDMVRDMFARFFSSDPFFTSIGDKGPALLSQYADRFSRKFVVRQDYSMAQIQGYLARFVREKNAPQLAVDKVEEYFSHEGSSQDRAGGVVKRKARTAPKGIPKTVALSRSQSAWN